MSYALVDLIINFANLILTAVVAILEVKTYKSGKNSEAHSKKPVRGKHVRGRGKHSK